LVNVPPVLGIPPEYTLARKRWKRSKGGMELLLREVEI